MPKKKIEKKVTTKKAKVVKEKKTPKSSATKIAKKVKVTKKTTVVAKKPSVKKATTKVKKTLTKSATKKEVKKTKKDYIADDDYPFDDINARAAARAEAIKKIKGYGKRDLSHFKKIIIAKRDEIVKQLQNLKEQMMDTSTGEYINENSPYSLHMAEQGTDAMEREKTFLYAQRESKFLSYLEAALKRIEVGTYGICLECIEQPKHLCESCPLVPKARLEAVPHSQVCLPIKQRQEKK